MSRRRLLFLGGNGHCAARLQPARDALAAAEGGPAFDLVDVECPGFDGRPPPDTLDALLEAVGRQIADSAGAAPLVYATGIGGLLALAVRARMPTPPLLLQAPVLWGLRHRRMPRLMRLPPARALARPLFGRRAFQRRFWRRHLQLPWEHPAREGFFAGYARCAAFADLFRWISPSWLGGLEERLRERPAASEGVRAWWGGRDTVVGPDELRLTEEALGVRWPLRVFPQWGHYPMLDDPAGWVRAAAAELEARYPPEMGGMKTSSAPSGSGASKRS